MEWSAHPPNLPTPEELTAYIGPRADLYRARFERFRSGGETRFAFSWNWPAFFGGAWWYLYRKMYWWTLLDLDVSIILGCTVFVPFLWAAARAVTGDYLYFRWAEWKIREARPRFPGGPPSGETTHLARLAREGGVNRWVPWVAVAGFLLIFAMAALFFGMLWETIPSLQEIWPRGPGRWT